MPTTVAIITDRYSEYQKGIVDLLVEELLAQGYRAICVSAHALVPNIEASRDDFACNSLYPLVDGYEVIGVVALLGAMGQGLSQSKLTRFVSQFSIPMVSIGGDGFGVPTVATFDAAGMRQLMEHLLNDSEVSSPAFIRGGTGETFTQTREHEYRSALWNHGIPINEDHFIQGFYDTEKAYDAVFEFLSEHPDVDALVACNDAMALGAARAASALGKRIPADIVISGFDDTDDATKHSPAITSIRQSLDQLAIITIDRLIAQLEEDVDPNERFDVGTELVVRNSTRRHMPMLSERGIVSVDEFKAVLSRELREVAKPDSINEEELVEAIWHSLSNSAQDFENLLRRLKPTINTHTMLWWSHTAHTFDQACEPFLNNEKTRGNALAVKYAIATIREAIWSVRNDNNYLESRRLNLNAQAQRDLSSSTRKDDIVQIFSKWLEASAIRTCYLITYELPGRVPHERSEVFLSWIDGEASCKRYADFSTTQLLPEPLNLFDSSDFMVQYPLYSSGNVYGYMLVDPQGVELGGMDAIANSVGNALRIRTLLKELSAQRDKLRKTNDKLQHLANVDTLTGLPNRHHVQTWMEHRFNVANKTSEKLAVLFLDLDGFKAINDSFGHAAGDCLLIEVSNRLNVVLKNEYAGESYLARLSGDEFIAVLSLYAGENPVMNACQSISDTLSEPFYLEGERACVSVSIGVAVYPDHASTAEATLKLADISMYRAKNAGKNDIIFYDGEQGDRAACVIAK